METNNYNNTSTNAKSNKVKRANVNTPKPIPELTEKDKQRFRSHVLINEETGCWEWKLSVNNRYGCGYFYINKDEGSFRAYKVAYSIFHGTIPEGLHIYHVCLNYKCVNPDHLWAGNRLDTDFNTYKQNKKGSSRSTKPKPIPELTEKDIFRFKTNVKINEKTGCWDWLLSTDITGYGRMTINRKSFRANRISYTIHKGPIPENMIICHTCDRRSCVNPDHLYAGTKSDNIRDSYTRNRRKLSFQQTNFWDKKIINPINFCWEWTGPTKDGTTNSYGIASNGDLAHRVSYILTYGDIPEDLVIRHKCDRKICINPDHLELGTYLDNAHDKYRNTENNKQFKLNVEQVTEIRKLFHEGKSAVNLAEQFNVSKNTINRIVTHDTWSTIKSDYPKAVIKKSHNVIPFELVQEIRETYGTGLFTQAEISRIFGVSTVNVNNYVNYKTRKEK